MSGSAFATPDAPRAADYTRCIRCGLCLNACPTFRVLGEELDSPRGRIYQVAAADAGRIGLDAGFELHMDRCLDCRACETACPSGVPYGQIIERTRAELQARRPLGWAPRYALNTLIPSPRRLRAAAALTRFYQRSGAQRLARASGLLRRLGLAEAERFCPPLTEPAFAAHGQTFAADGPARARVLFLPGCVQNVLLAGLNHATVRVLRRQGCEVTVGDVGCCGALHVHAGLRDDARALARRNIAALEKVAADAIVVNAAGCGAALKDYPELLDHPGDGAEWLPRARRLAARIRDVTEFLDALGLRAGRLGAIPVRATYQDPCHLAHAQRIRQAPRRLLAAIPGLELIEMQRADQCCGSAGIYNLLQPEIAAALGRDRQEAIAATGAELVVTANPGCMLQLQAALRQIGAGGPEVLHVMEVLDRAQRAAR